MFSCAIRKHEVPIVKNTKNGESPGVVEQSP